MFVKVFLVCAVVAVAMGAEYPPGIHPSLCPNYPYCNMEVLMQHTPQGMPIPTWMMPNAAYRSARPAAAKYPANVDLASCPDYPFCRQ